MKLHTQLDSGSRLAESLTKTPPTHPRWCCRGWSRNPPLCTIGRRPDERASPSVHDVLCIPRCLIDRYIGEPSEGWKHEEEPDEKYSCADDLADEGEPQQVFHLIVHSHRCYPVPRWCCAVSLPKEPPAPGSHDSETAKHQSEEPGAGGKVNPIRDEAPERGFVAMLDVVRVGVLRTTHNSCIGEPPVIYEGAFRRRW